MNEIKAMKEYNFCGEEERIIQGGKKITGKLKRLGKNQ